jgi:PRTRC genetic system protein B
VVNVKPLRQEDLSKLYFFLKNYYTSGLAQLSGAIPFNMVFMDPLVGTYAWTVPAKRRPIYFDKDMKITDGYYPYPNMLFVVRDEELNVYIYKDELKPGSKVYRPPFLNTFDEGNICLGTTNTKSIKKAKNFQEFMTAWENVFFNSKFSSGAGGSLKFMEAMLNKKSFNWISVLKKFKIRPRKLKSILR